MARARSAAAATAAVLVAVILMAVAFPPPAAAATHFTEELPPGVTRWPPALLVSESSAPSSSLDVGVVDVGDAFPDAAAPSVQQQPAAVDVSAASAFLIGARRAGPVILP
jgi:hypothetical protein